MESSNGVSSCVVSMEEEKKRDFQEEEIGGSGRKRQRRDDASMESAASLRQSDEEVHLKGGQESPTSSNGRARLLRKPSNGGKWTEAEDRKLLSIVSLFFAPCL